MERQFYETHYTAFIESQNERNAKIRHTERNRSIPDLLSSRKTCPEETIYQLGTLDEHASAEDLLNIVTEFIEEFKTKYGDHVHVLDWALHLDESTPHIHERHVFDCENKHGEVAPQQEKALEALGFELPDPDKPLSRRNNRKITFDAACRKMLFDIAKRHGLELEEEAEYGNRKYLEKQDFILAKQKERLTAQQNRLDELTLKVNDMETLIDEVSAAAYDKAVEVVTDVVRTETRKEDMRMIEDTKKWVLSPERKAPQATREYAAHRLDTVLDKFLKTMQTTATRLQEKLLKPEVRQKGKEQVKEKARDSVLQLLNRLQAELPTREALPSFLLTPFPNKSTLRKMFLGKETPMNTAAFTAYREKVVSNCARVIVGKEDATEKILVSFLCGGHVLLEDKPGTGKTMLLRAFARTVGGNFKRVQFTPDLLPSDLTGINFYNQKSGEFEFRPGPLFTNFVLADEINRATPRTQSALLEAMEERQITVDGVTSRLAEPFMVLATQNPLESFGTFPLPDAQMDRFFMRLSLGYMTREQELEVLSRPSAQTVLNELQAVVTPEETAYVRTAYREVKVSEEVKHYLMDIVEATRTQSGFVSGVSTRGALALYQAAQAYASLQGREYVIPEDIKGLAPAVLSHRISLGSSMNAEAAALRMRKLLAEITVPLESAE